MTLTVNLLFWILAAVCFALATFSVNFPPRVNLVALGLLFATLTFIF